MHQIHFLAHAFEQSGSLTCELVGLSLDIASNEFVAILEPSGTPTTLLFSILGGGCAPTAGRVVIEGVSLYDVPHHRLQHIRMTQIGRFSHTMGLRGSISACRSVEAPLIPLGIHAWERRALAIEALQQVGISYHTDHLNCELSSVQKMQVGLARAIVHKPRLLLVEVTHNALPPDVRRQMLRILGDLHKKGHTVVIVTDNSSTAAVAQRTVSPIKRPRRDFFRRAAA